MITFGYKYLFINISTTGLNPVKDFLLEVVATLVSDKFNLLANEYYLIKPDDKEIEELEITLDLIKQRKRAGENLRIKDVTLDELIKFGFNKSAVRDNLKNLLHRTDTTFLVNGLTQEFLESKLEVCVPTKVVYVLDAVKAAFNFKGSLFQAYNELLSGKEINLAIEKALQNDNVLVKQGLLVLMAFTKII
ncbi:MAG: hypothetical protein QW303_01980 [Nitrososphaerota archaeon]